jgi:hypothetical protein
LPENLPQVAPPTQKDRNELRDAFRDYAAHRLNKSWKNEYASEKQNPHNKERMSKEAIVLAMQRNQEIKNIAKGQPTVQTKATPNQDQVKRQIKAMRMSM